MFNFLKRKSARKNSTTNIRRRPMGAGLEQLEDRRQLAVSNLWFSGAMLVVAADNNSTSVEVRSSGANVQITEVGSGRSWSYASSQVGSVEFQGGAGNDRFVNNVANLAVRAFGNSGDDYLEGYNGADYFSGGNGNDTLVGYGGNDTFFGGAGSDVLRGLAGNDQLTGDDGNDQIEGGAGNDILWGGLGNDLLLGNENDDQLVGGDGDDQLNGQAGADRLWGGNGNDVLIAIDALFADYVQTDAGNDIAWLDSGESPVDNSGTDKTQSVSGFANGADRTLDGDRIADPRAMSGQVYKQFAGRPLFSSTGPAATDIRQGAIGDCWLLAGVAAIALDRPAAIRENVVDFNDGTYGVRLGNSFYRVDNDLPVNGTAGTTPANAQLGAASSMWVAVLEKAYTHYRTGANSYASIEGGWSIEVSRAFRSAAPGERALESYANATELANAVFNLWNTYQAVTIGFLGTRSGSSGTPLVMGHMYMVWSVARNSAGAVTSITLRNPWGFDGGGSADSNTSDGLVTITPAQLFSYIGRVNWGRV